MQISPLILSSPLPSYSMYVIVLVKCRPLIEPLTTFAFPQHVCCWYKAQTSLLILLPCVHFYSVYVIVLAKCKAPCWFCCYLWLYMFYSLSVCMWWSFQNTDVLLIPSPPIFSQEVCDCACKVQIPHWSHSYLAFPQRVCDYACKV